MPRSSGSSWKICAVGMPPNRQTVHATPRYIALGRQRRAGGAPAEAKLPRPQPLALMRLSMPGMSLPRRHGAAAPRVEHRQRDGARDEDHRDGTSRSAAAAIAASMSEIPNSAEVRRQRRRVGQQVDRTVVAILGGVERVGAAPAGRIEYTITRNARSATTWSSRQARRASRSAPSRASPGSSAAGCRRRSAFMRTTDRSRSRRCARRRSSSRRGGDRRDRRCETRACGRAPRSRPTADRASRSRPTRRPRDSPWLVRGARRRRPDTRRSRRVLSA